MYKRKYGGLKAKLNGELFEQAIVNHAQRTAFSVIQIPNGAKVAKVKGRLTSVRVKSPFDFILAKQSRVAFLDAKTIEDGNFTFSMLKPHQVENLLRLERQRIAAGYLIFYRNINAVVFFKASILSALRRGESLKIEDGIRLGSRETIEFEKLWS